MDKKDIAKFIAEFNGFNYWEIKNTSPKMFEIKLLHTLTSGANAVVFVKKNGVKVEIKFNEKNKITGEEKQEFSFEKIEKWISK